MVIFDDFLRPVFAASPVQHVSDLHLKFALRPDHVCNCASMVDIQSATAEIRQGKKKKERRTRMWAIAQRDGRPAEYSGAFCSTPQSLADAHY